MTPVANRIVDHLRSRIVAIVGDVEVKPISSALVMPNSMTKMVRVEVADDVREPELDTMGAQGAVGMSLEVDVVVFARASKDSSLEARTLNADITTMLLKDHGVITTDDGIRYRAEHAGDDQETDGDGATEITVIRTQFSALYRHRRDNPAIAA